MAFNITLPTDSNMQVASTTSDVIAGLEPVFALILGILLGLFIIEELIDHFRFKREMDRADAAIAESERLLH